MYLSGAWLFLLFMVVVWCLPLLLYLAFHSLAVKPLAEHFSNWLPHLLISTFKASLAYSIRRIHRAEQSTSGALATGYCYRPPRVALVMLTLLHGRRLSLLRERRKEGGRTKGSPPGAFPLLDLATQSRHDANAFLARSL